MPRALQIRDVPDDLHATVRARAAPRLAPPPARASASDVPEISSSRAEQARVLFGDTPKIRFPSFQLTQRIWSLRHNLGAYDACFIALAESLEAPLITCDGKQVGASGHRAEIEAFSADSS
jgi:predicted nucleic acid-binding protein